MHFASPGADQPCFEQIELRPTVHLPLHELESGDLPLGLAIRPRLDQRRGDTDRIIAELEAGRLPWVQPWSSDRIRAPLGLPANAATGRRYSGINILILWCAVVERGFAGQGWLTFRQARALGGSMRKGERGTLVVYADRFTPRDERTWADRNCNAARSIPFLKQFTVFNTEQCDGLPGGAGETAVMVPPGLILPQVETLIARSGADLQIGGDRAFYDRERRQAPLVRHRSDSRSVSGAGSE